ncbi:MAG TPA: Na+/H+ antiporter subunit B [Clostridia bacterium]|nr:Na+/H+ antiporter subunit B [Clostridia bacterium]
MTSLILQTAARFLIPLMLLFSLFLLLRGHNDPGGGFSGGLVATGAFVLYATAYDVASARRALRVDPHQLCGAGLLVALLSGVAGLFTGKPFLTGLWWTDLEVAHRVKISLGTPFLFDVGVYLAVLGAAVMILLELMEESK